MLNLSASITLKEIDTTNQPQLGFPAKREMCVIIQLFSNDVLVSCEAFGWQP